MNEEEKEAIEILKSPLLKSDGYDRHQKAIDIILNLIEKQQKEIEELRNRKAENYYHWQHLEAKIINKKEEYEKDRANMTQIIFFSKYGKTQQTFIQAVVNEIIKVLDEILGE